MASCQGTLRVSSPSSHARGAGSRLLSDGRKTPNISLNKKGKKNLKEFNRKFKMQERAKEAGLKKKKRRAEQGGEQQGQFSFKNKEGKE